MFGQEIFDSYRNSWNEEEWKKQMEHPSQEIYEYYKLLFESTVKIVKDGCYVTSQGNKVTLPSNELYSKLYSEEFHPDVNKIYDTKVYVINEDCLVLARDLGLDGNKVAVLNMCSYKSPGGSAWNGKCGQEEYLVNCSDYYKDLLRYGCFAEKYSLRPAEKKYPLDLRYGGVFTRGVTVFRDSADAGFRLLETPFKVCMIGVPALSSPETVLVENEPRMVERDVDIIKDKIRTIFNIAVEQGIRSLVLGAWGCGGYRNPPKHAAEIFKEMLEEYKGVFRDVYFAIKDTYVKGNYQVFRNVLTQKTYPDISKYNSADIESVGNIKFDIAELIKFVAQDWVLGETHGLQHWTRVHENIIRLCQLNKGVNMDVALAFAYLHDSCRRYDGRDINHGERAVDNVMSLRNTILNKFSDGEIKILCEACKLHTSTIRTGNITIDTCFDADRLDISRVGICPDPEKMATNGGKSLI